MQTITSVHSAKFRNLSDQKHHMFRNQESVRRRNEHRLETENHKFLSRLQATKSFYNTGKWQQERLENEKLLKNKCKYPHLFQLETQRSRSTLPRFLNLPSIDLRKSQNFKTSSRGFQQQPDIVVSDEGERLLDSPADHAAVPRRQRESMHQVQSTGEESMYSQQQKSPKPVKRLRFKFARAKASLTMARSPKRSR